MLKKQIEFAAHYVVNEWIGYYEIESPKSTFKDLDAYNAFIDLFQTFAPSFDVDEFNKRIEILLLIYKK